MPRAHVMKKILQISLSLCLFRNMYVNISTVVFLKGSTNWKNINKIYRTNDLYIPTFTEYVLNYR
jgi:hypothetical protein